MAMTQEDVDRRGCRILLGCGLALLAAPLLFVGVLLTVCGTPDRGGEKKIPPRRHEVPDDKDKEGRRPRE
jgi:hypothetical protein